MCVICHILYTLDIPQILHSVYKTFWHLGFSFTYDAPKILKKMTIDVTSATSLNTLRKRLKTTPKPTRSHISLTPKPTRFHISLTYDNLHDVEPPKDKFRAF